MRVEPALVDELVGEVIGEPGALPLLSTALLELWERAGRAGDPTARRTRDGRRPGRGRAPGRGRRTRGSTEEQQAIARGVLLRLAGPGEGDGVVRRRVPLAEFDVERNPDVAHGARRADRRVGC